MAMPMEEQLEEVRKMREHYEKDINKYGGGHMNYSPVEHTDYASKALAGTALGLSIPGVVSFAKDVLGNGNGGWFGCGNNQNYVTQKEFELGQKLAEKETHVRLLESNIYTDNKRDELYHTLHSEARADNDKIYERLDKIQEKIECNKAAQDAINTQQVAFNAAQTAMISCIKGQVEQLYTLTKLVVPNGSVCPGWGNATITPASTTTASA